MADPAFDDPGPPIPESASRVRRALMVVLLLTLVASMVFLAFVSGRGVTQVRPPPTPQSSVGAPRMDGSRLAVVDAAGQLSTTDALGGSVVRYGDAGIAFSIPAWSPDGTRIAAIGARAGETAVYVFAVPAAGEAAAEPAIVYASADRAPFYLYWSPDSRALTFLTTEPDGLALRSVAAEAGARAAVIRQGSPLYWAWVDPAHLLVHSGGEGIGAFLGEVDAAGVAQEPVAIQPGGFRAPAVTTDGRFRAYVTPTDGSSERVTVETRDRASSHAVDVFGAAAIDFGPGTNQLAFIAPAQSGIEQPLPVGPLRLIDAATGDVRTIMAGPVLGFFWAPDGRTIATIQIAAPGDDKVADTGRAILAKAGEPVTRATTRPAAGSGVALRIAFVNVESGAVRSRSSFRLADTFVQQVLPYFDQYALSHRLWSPDSASLAVPIVADDGTNQLMVVQADGSDARRVAEGVAGFWSP